MDIPFETLKEGLQKLEYMVQAREKLRDTSFYEEFAKDCCKFADKLLQSGADKEDIAAVMSWTKIW